LVIASIDRLCRYEILSDFGEIIKPFDTLLTAGGKHKRLWCDASDANGLDTHDKADQSKIFHAAEYAALERDKIRYRTVEARDMNRMEGNRKTDKLPAGVRFVLDNAEDGTGHFEYTPEAERVKAAFKAVLDGVSLGKVAKIAGYTQQAGLRRCLRSEWWLGYKTSTTIDEKVEINGKMRRTGNRALRAEPIRAETNLVAAPLVSRKDWDAVQDVLNHHAEVNANRDKTVKNDFLAAGLLFCSCGRRMYHSAIPNRYYKCARNYGARTSQKTSKRLEAVPCDTKSIKAEILDAVVVDDAAKNLKNPDFVEARIKESMDKDEQDRNRLEVERATDEVKRLEKDAKKLKALYMATEDPTIPADLKLLNGELATARNRQRTAESKLSEMLSDTTIKRVAARVAKRFDGFETKTTLDQKAILNEYVERINIIFRLPSALAVPTATDDFLPEGTTELGREKAEEWARNVLAFVQGKPAQWALEFKMKSGSPDPYVSGNGSNGSNFNDLDNGECLANSVAVTTLGSAGLTARATRSGLSVLGQFEKTYPKR
jgi:hypothetical protein